MNGTKREPILYGFPRIVSSLGLALALLLPAEGLAADAPNPSGLTLEKGIEISLARHPLLKEKSAEIASAEAGIGMATASYYPRMETSIGYERFEHPAVFFRPSGAAAESLGDAIGPLDDFTARIEARWTLWDGGVRRAERDASVARRDAAGEDRETARQRLIYGVREAFYDHVAALRLEDVGGKSVSRAKEHLSLAKERFKAGAAPKADVYKAQVDLAGAELSLVSARSVVRSTMARLNTAMGMPAETKTRVVPPSALLLPPGDTDLAAGLSAAASRRPELTAASLSVTASEAGIRKARAAYLPRLAASGTAGVRDTDFVPEEKDWTAGVTLSWPIFTGFARGHEVKRAEAEVGKEQARYQNLLNRVGEEVVVAHSRIRETYEAIQAAEVLLADARESLRMAEERYAAGAGTILDLLDAQVAMTRAEANAVVASLSHQAACSRFLLATGRL